MTTSQLSVRVPTALREWLEAHASLTGRSLNETVNQMLAVMLEGDPLDSFAIRRLGSRFIIVSQSGNSTFGPYRTKEAALNGARKALELNGYEPTNIDDEAEKDAA